MDPSPSNQQQKQLTVTEAGRAVRVETDLPHLVGLGSGRFSTAVTLHPLPEGRTTVGNSNSDIIIRGRHMEPQHCYFVNENDVVVLFPISDVISVDGAKVTRPTVLSQGSMICFGRNQYFRFNHPAEAQHLKSEYEDIYNENYAVVAVDRKEPLYANEPVPSPAITGQPSTPIYDNINNATTCYNRYSKNNNTNNDTNNNIKNNTNNTNINSSIITCDKTYDYNKSAFHLDNDRNSTSIFANNNHNNNKYTNDNKANMKFSINKNYYVNKYNNINSNNRSSNNDEPSKRVASHKNRIPYNSKNKQDISSSYNFSDIENAFSLEYLQSFINDHLPLERWNDNYTNFSHNNHNNNISNSLNHRSSNNNNVNNTTGNNNANMFSAAVTNANTLPTSFNSNCYTINQGEKANECDVVTNLLHEDQTPTNAANSTCDKFNERFDLSNWSGYDNVLELKKNIEALEQSKHNKEYSTVTTKTNWITATVLVTTTTTTATTTAATTLSSLSSTLSTPSMNTIMSVSLLVPSPPLITKAPTSPVSTTTTTSLQFFLSDSSIRYVSSSSDEPHRVEPNLHLPLNFNKDSPTSSHTDPMRSNVESAHRTTAKAPDPANASNTTGTTATKPTKRIVALDGCSPKTSPPSSAMTVAAVATITVTATTTTAAAATTAAATTAVATAAATTTLTNTLKPSNPTTTVATITAQASTVSAAIISATVSTSSPTKTSTTTTTTTSISIKCKNNNHIENISTSVDSSSSNTINQSNNSSTTTLDDSDSTSSVVVSSKEKRKVTIRKQKTKPSDAKKNVTFDLTMQSSSEDNKHKPPTGKFSYNKARNTTDKNETPSCKTTNNKNKFFWSTKKIREKLKNKNSEEDCRSSCESCDDVCPTNAATKTTVTVISNAYNPLPPTQQRTSFFRSFIRSRSSSPVKKNVIANSDSTTTATTASPATAATNTTSINHTCISGGNEKNQAAHNTGNNVNNCSKVQRVIRLKRTEAARRLSEPLKTSFKSSLPSALINSSSSLQSSFCSSPSSSFPTSSLSLATTSGTANNCHPTDRRATEAAIKNDYNKNNNNRSKVTTLNSTSSISLLDAILGHTRRKNSNADDSNLILTPSPISSSSNSIQMNEEKKMICDQPLNSSRCRINLKTIKLDDYRGEKVFSKDTVTQRVLLTPQPDNSSSSNNNNNMASIDKSIHDNGIAPSTSNHGNGNSSYDVREPPIYDAVYESFRFAESNTSGSSTNSHNNTNNNIIINNNNNNNNHYCRNEGVDAKYLRGGDRQEILSNDRLEFEDKEKMVKHVSGRSTITSFTSSASIESNSNNKNNNNNNNNNNNYSYNKIFKENEDEDVDDDTLTSSTTSFQSITSPANSATTTATATTTKNTTNTTNAAIETTATSNVIIALDDGDNNNSENRNICKKDVDEYSGRVTSIASITFSNADNKGVSGRKIILKNKMNDDDEDDDGRRNKEADDFHSKLDQNEKNLKNVSQISKMECNDGKDEVDDCNDGGLTAALNLPSLAQLASLTSGRDDDANLQQLIMTRRMVMQKIKMLRLKISEIEKKEQNIESLVGH